MIPEVIRNRNLRPFDRVELVVDMQEPVRLAIQRKLCVQFDRLRPRLWSLAGPSPLPFTPPKKGKAGAIDLDRDRGRDKGRSVTLLVRQIEAEIEGGKSLPHSTESR